MSNPSPAIMTSEARTIHEYARDGNLAGVLDSLAKGTNVDARDPNNDHTPLMEAVSSSKPNIDLVRQLIQRGADVNAVATDRSFAVPHEFITTFGEILDQSTENAASIPNLEAMKRVHGYLEKRMLPGNEGIGVIKRNVLSLAISSGNVEIIRMLLDAGADVRYELPHRYDALISVNYRRRGAGNYQLVPIIRLLIDHGAKLNTTSAYSESALKIASGEGRFDAVAVLLAAGADPAPLQWTPLMRAIALGPLDDVREQIRNGTDLSARDGWSRTPWLISLTTGDVAKAKLLLARGATRNDRGWCGKTSLMYPITCGHADMLRWLLSEGFDPNETDDYGGTPLMKAAQSGETECVKILIDAGADIHREQHGEAAIKLADNLGVVRLLVTAGADIGDISDEMHAELTKLPFDERIDASIEDYQAARHRRFGTSNPEKMNFPFWQSMVRSGAIAYAARRHFNDIDAEEAIWCFKRFGKSITELPDGRIIEIAGEHEDFYDPDFCIYNDVIAHHGDGQFDIYGYPKSCFAPTDSHSATVVGRHIYIIGSLGYQSERKLGETQVYRLDIDSFEIAAVPTFGESPGWISRHKAAYVPEGRIRITGGKICALVTGKEEYQDNSVEYFLDLSTSIWSKAAGAGSSVGPVLPA